MQKCLLLVVFFHSIWMTGSAQRKEPREAVLLTEFAFTQLTGGVILIQAQLDTLSTPLNFILDTGSGAISLDSTTVEEFQIPNVPSGKSVRGLAGVKEVNFAPHHTLSFPGLSVDSLDFFINNYELLSSVYGIKIDGIIGYSFFKRYIVYIDYDKLKISVFSPGKIRYPKGGSLLSPSFTAIPIQALQVEDERALSAYFYIDSGAGLCLLLTESFVQDSGFFRKKRRLLPILAQGLGGKKPIHLTISRKIKIGPYSFKNVPTHVLEDTYNVISYPHLGGLIGNDLLRRFNVYFNYPAKEIYIKPNTHYKSPFDYSYSGLNLYYEDGVIEINDIAAESPADKAGLKNGDQLVAVNKLFGGNIQEYKDILSRANTMVTLIVLRDNELMTVRFKVGKIF